MGCSLVKLQIHDFVDEDAIFQILGILGSWRRDHHPPNSSTPMACSMPNWPLETKHEHDVPEYKTEIGTGAESTSPFQCQYQPDCFGG